MQYSYDITQRPAELGGGWRLRLLEDGVEVGGGVFPPVENGNQNPKDVIQVAFADAEA